MQLGFIAEPGRCRCQICAARRRNQPSRTSRAGSFWSLTPTTKSPAPAVVAAVWCDMVAHMDREHLDRFTRSTWRRFDAKDLEPLNWAIIRRRHPRDATPPVDAPRAIPRSAGDRAREREWGSVASRYDSPSSFYCTLSRSSALPHSDRADSVIITPGSPALETVGTSRGEMALKPGLDEQVHGNVSL